MCMGALFIQFWFRHASESASFFSSSSTTTNDQFCKFPAEGAQVPASNISPKISKGIFLDK